MEFEQIKCRASEETRCKGSENLAERKDFCGQVAEKALFEGEQAEKLHSE